MDLGLSVIGRVLAELEITPQKPLRRAYERDPKAIDHRIRCEYPKLRERAQRSGAKILEGSNCALFINNDDDCLVVQVR